MSNSTLPDIAQLEAQVRHRLRGQACNLRLVVRDDGVVLQGCVRTCYAKQLAQQAVMKATGLPILANEIEVSSNSNGTGDGGATPTAGQLQGSIGGYADGEV
jgi:osmotically-inducible protein OsmY